MWEYQHYCLNAYIVRNTRATDTGAICQIIIIIIIIITAIKLSLSDSSPYTSKDTPNKNKYT
jgi:hypothetical protein